MSAEATVWERLTRSRPADVLGYLPGAIDDGLLAVSSENGAGRGLLRYRAFASADSDTRSFDVGGLELALEYDRARRVDGSGGTEPSVVASLVQSILPAGVSLLGRLPSSDSASLLVTRPGTTDALQLWVAWWEDASTLIVLPAQVRVPAAALIPVTSRAAAPASPQLASARATPATPRDRPVQSPSRSRVRPILTAVVLLVVAGGGWELVSRMGGVGGSRSADPADTDSMTIALDPLTRDSLSAQSGAVDTAATVPDSSLQKPDPIPRRERTNPVPPRREPAPVDSGGREAPTTRPARTRDVDADKADLRALEDQSLDTEARSATQWQELGARAERLFERLLEPDNRSDLARVILRSYGNGGGSKRACRYLDDVRDASDSERRLFSISNRCS